MTQAYSFIINFLSTEGTSWVLPQSQICIHDKTGHPAYLKAAGTMETVASYGITVTDPIKNLINECKDLRLDEMEAFFNRNKKKAIRLNVLFDDPATKQYIQDYIDRKINKIIIIALEENVPLSYDLVRKEHFYNFKILTPIHNITPSLKFTKTQTGVNYTMQLAIGDITFLPKERNIILLSKEFGWLIIDGQLAQLQYINTNKIKPFLTKESIYILEKTVRTYFQKFVLDVMSEVEIVAEGFEVVKNNVCTGQKIVFVYDFIKEIWLVDVIFSYTKECFKMSSPAKRKTFIDFNAQDHLTVYEITRMHDYETKIINELVKIGFTKQYQNYLQTGENKYDALHLVSQHEETLKVLFDIEKPQIDERKISLFSLSIETQFTQKLDWFDLHGTIHIGAEEYPFRRLMQNIKNDDPFFKLKDGTFAIIPEEIMHKYESTAKFSKEVNGVFRLSKVHHTLIEVPALPIEIKPKDNPAILEAFSPSPLLKATLRPYQVEGVQWLINHRKNGLGACLADDMGLGKTLQTIAALLDAREHKEVCTSSHGIIQLDLFGEIVATGRKSLGALIILPASLVYNWYFELKKYCPAMQVLNYTGTKRRKAQKTLLEFDFILTTYHTVMTDADILRPLTFYYIVLDESHYIKNKDSKSFKVINSLNAHYKISLTGTPIENSLADLWSQMEFINPSILGGFEFFKKNYQNPMEKEQNDEALQELKTLIQPYILRRVKSEVAKDLPELIETVQYAEMSDEQARTYEKEKSAVRNYIYGLDKNAQSYKIHVFTALMRLRQIANHPYLVNSDFIHESGKFEAIKSEIKTIIRSGQKVLIFSSFKSFLTLLSEWLQQNNIQYGYISGSKTIEERQSAVESFQNGSQTQVLLITLKAGGTGLNITSADYVLILEPWWNPFAEMQAVARAHRIGRTHNVVVKRFISLKSIDEKIALLQSQKKSMAENILDVEFAPTLTDKDIEVLLE